MDLVFVGARFIESVSDETSPGGRACIGDFMEFATISFELLLAYNVGISPFPRKRVIMNPPAVDYAVIQKTILFLTVLSFFVERSLAYLFELDLYGKFDKKFPSGKELIALVFSFALCQWGNFDAFSILMGQPTGPLSMFLTALLVAGGSKGSMKLMQDYLGINKEIIRANKKARILKNKT